MPSHTPRERARRGKSRRLVSAAFREVEHDEPSVVGKTRRKFGTARAEAQKKAIALAKARKAGARVPRRPGGVRRARSA